MVDKLPKNWSQPPHKQFAVVYQMMDDSIKYEMMSAVTRSAAVALLRRKKGVRMVISVRPATVSPEGKK